MLGTWSWTGLWLRGLKLKLHTNETQRRVLPNRITRAYRYAFFRNQPPASAPAGEMAEVRRIMVEADLSAPIVNIALSHPPSVKQPSSARRLSGAPSQSEAGVLSFEFRVRPPTSTSPSLSHKWRVGRSSVTASSSGSRRLLLHSLP